jgi:hypothetical protein
MEIAIDWLKDDFELFGMTIQNWMVAVAAIVALSITVAFSKS